MTPETDLLPCPFCGSRAELITQAPETFVRCTNDHCCPGRNLIETAVNDWNTRTPNKSAEVDLDLRTEVWNGAGLLTEQAEMHLDRILAYLTKAGYLSEGMKAQQHYDCGYHDAARECVEKCHLATGKGGDEWKQTVRDIYDALHFGVNTVFNDGCAKDIVGMIERRHPDYFCEPTEQQKTAEPDDNTQIWQTIQSRQDQTQPAETGIVKKSDNDARIVKTKTENEQPAAPTQIDAGELEKVIAAHDGTSEEYDMDFFYDNLSVVVEAARAHLSKLSGGV